MTPASLRPAPRCPRCGGPIAALEDVRVCETCLHGDPHAWRDARSGQWWDVPALMDAWLAALAGQAAEGRRAAELAVRCEAAEAALVVALERMEATTEVAACLV